MKNRLFIVIYNIFRRHNNRIYLLIFNITYIITLLHVSTLMNHLQAQISRPIVHIVLQFLCLTDVKTVKFMPEDDSKSRNMLQSNYICYIEVK